MTTNGEIEVLSKEEAQELQTDLSNIQGRANSLIVKDEQSYQMGAETIVWAKQAISKCEDRRKFFVKPLQDHVSRINLFFKNFSEPLSVLRDKVEGKMLTYRSEQRLKQEAEEARLRKLQEKENKKLEKKGLEPLPAVAIPQAPKTTFSDTGSVTAKLNWTWEVVNIKSVPQKYFILDEKQINALVRGGVRSIMGLRIFQEETLSVK